MDTPNLSHSTVEHLVVEQPPVSSSGNLSLKVIHGTSGKTLISCSFFESGLRRPHNGKVYYVYLGRSLNYEIEDLIPILSEKVNWPAGYLILVFEQEVFCLQTRIIDRTHTSFASLMSEGNPQDIILQLFLDAKPSDFTQAPGYCVCDFGGCCCDCAVAGPRVCSGCGNNNWCCSGNCGHSCCELRCQEILENTPIASCPLIGCKPWWASSKPVTDSQGIPT